MPSAVLKITPGFALLMRLFVHFGDTSDSRALLPKVSVCTCSQRSYAPLCLIQVADLPTELREVGLCCSLANLQQQGEKGCSSHGEMEMGQEKVYEGTRKRGCKSRRSRSKKGGCAGTWGTGLKERSC